MRSCCSQGNSSFKESLNENNHSLKKIACQENLHPMLWPVQTCCLLPHWLQRGEFRELWKGNVQLSAQCSDKRWHHIPLTSCSKANLPVFILLLQIEGKAFPGRVGSAGKPRPHPALTLLLSIAGAGGCFSERLKNLPSSQTEPCMLILMSF